MIKNDLNLPQSHLEKKRYNSPASEERQEKADIQHELYFPRRFSCFYHAKEDLMVTTDDRKDCLSQITPHNPPAE